MDELLLTYAICTRNRGQILIECLESIKDQISLNPLIDCVVVDNNSTDNTVELFQQHFKENPQFRIVTETQQGVSFARNRCLDECRGKWIHYIDDDARLLPGFTEELLKVIASTTFEITGGLYLPWYRNNIKTPWWLPSPTSGIFSNILGKPKVEKDISETGIYLSASNLGGWKSKYLEIGGFDTNIRNNAEIIAYGEETRLLIVARKHKLKIGWLPQLKIEHLVPESKLHLSYFYKLGAGGAASHAGVHQSGNSTKARIVSCFNRTKWWVKQVFFCLTFQKEIRFIIIDSVTSAGFIFTTLFK